MQRYLQVKPLWPQIRNATRKQFPFLLPQLEHVPASMRHDKLDLPCLSKRCVDTLLLANPFDLILILHRYDINNFTRNIDLLFDLLALDEALHALV